MKLLNNVAAAALGVVFLSLALPTIAEADEMARARMICDSLKKGGIIYDNGFSTDLVFYYYGGRVHATKYLKRRPGEEVFDGSVRADGRILISGSGRRYDPFSHSWIYGYRGQIASEGPTVIEGGLRVVETGATRQCQILFDAEESRLLAETIFSARAFNGGGALNVRRRAHELTSPPKPAAAPVRNAAAKRAKVPDAPQQASAAIGVADVARTAPVNPKVGRPSTSVTVYSSVNLETPEAEEAPSAGPTVTARRDGEAVRPPEAPKSSVRARPLASPSDNAPRESIANPPTSAPSAPPPKVADASPSPAAGPNGDDANQRIVTLKVQIIMLTKVLNEQMELQKNAPPELQISVESAIQAIKERMEKLRAEYSAVSGLARNYLTPITPDDQSLYDTARKASEIYPKIPYYIPGTAETGEFWVEPKVSEQGELRFQFKFIDRDASVEQVRETIDMSLPEAEDTQKALFKLKSWSDVAHENKLRQNYEKRVTCFPTDSCLADGEHVDGKSSTEVLFSVYEDGATAGRIQKNKGKFVEGFNFSIESAMLLQAYLGYVINEAETEYNSGIQDQHSLDKLFQ